MNNFKKNILKNFKNQEISLKFKVLCLSCFIGLYYLILTSISFAYLFNLSTKNNNLETLHLTTKIPFVMMSMLILLLFLNIFASFKNTFSESFFERKKSMVINLLLMILSLIGATIFVKYSITSSEIPKNYIFPLLNLLTSIFGSIFTMYFYCQICKKVWQKKLNTID